VIRNKAAREPHNPQSPSLTLELNPIEIAPDIEQQRHRRMISRPASCLRIDPAEPKLGKTKFVDKHVNYANPDCPRLSSLSPFRNSVLCSRSTHSTNHFIRSPVLCGDHIARIKSRCFYPAWP
jgi:hypothetical protein